MTTKVITNNRPILLGKSGENEATLIRFPINIFFPFVKASYYSLAHQRHGDVAPYLCVISKNDGVIDESGYAENPNGDATQTVLNDGFIDWPIKSADVANQGNGIAQLTAYNEEGLVAKTVVFTTVVTDSLGYVTPPAPHVAWVDQVAGYARTAEQAAVQASEAAATAQSVFAPGGGRDSIVSVNAVHPNVASEHDSVAIGGGNQSTASGAVTIGTNNIANAQNAVAIGSKLIEADPNTASAPAATALGLSCTASGYGSVAMGYNTTASNTGAFSAGYTSVASGQAAASIGFQTTASGTAAAAIGYGTTASGTGAAAVGRDATASGAASTALGRGTTASASQALAAGRDSKAEAIAATALGYGTDATGARSLVAGAYNAPDTNEVDTTHGSGARKYVMIIGNGTADTARSNAATLDWDGNAVFAGKATVGAAPTADMDVATKKYVDDNAGGGGTSDYTDLTNKPQINGNTLTGNKTAAALGLAAASAIPTKVSDLTNDSGFVNASGAASAAPVQSVNGQTGAVTVQAATDAQVETAVNTWLGNNVAQETGYVLDASLTMSNAAAPASAVGDLKSAVTNLEKNTIYTVELDTLQKVVPFFVNAGDTVVVKATNGSAITVGQIRFVRENGTNDYWTISGYNERVITMTEPFVGVYMNNGTVQNITVTNESSPANFHTETDQLREDIDAVAEKVEVVADNVGITNPEYTVVNGYFITTNGSKSAAGAFVYSEPIAIKKGTKVSFRGAGYNTAVAMISTCAEDGSSIVPQVICTDSNVNNYEYTATTDGYIIICYDKNKEHSLTLSYDRIGSIEAEIETAISVKTITPSSLNTGFIHRDGRIMEASNFRYTNPIKLENETIKFTARGYSDAVSLLSLCDVNGSNRINIVNSTADAETKEVEYSCHGVEYVVISSNAAVPIQYTTTKLNTIINNPYVSLSMFQKFGVVGDSYASGALFYDNKEKDDYAHSWGQILARKLGTACTNYSKGGLSTRTWLTDSKGLPLVLASEAEEIYYLALGINDYYSLGTAYLGSISDITSHTSYTDYADSFYGNYGRIIEQIKAYAPYAKIIMFSIAGIGENAVRDSYNDAIIEIANHYSIPYIVQNDDQFFLSDFYNQTKVEGHPIAITYSGMAEAFERLLISCIRNNVAYFKNTFWYD